ARRAHEARRQRLQRHARQPLRLRLRRIVRPAPADRGGGPDDAGVWGQGRLGGAGAAAGPAAAAAALNPGERGGSPMGLTIYYHLSTSLADSAGVMKLVEALRSFALDLPLDWV